MYKIEHPTINVGQYAYLGRQSCTTSNPTMEKPKPPILCPTIHPGKYPYFGKEPNSAKLRFAYEEKFRKINELYFFDPYQENPDSKILTENQLEDRVNRKRYQQDINKRFLEKIDAYVAEVNKRRNKLRDLYYTEEQEFIRETVNQAIKGERERNDGMKRAVEEIKARREEERKQLVHQKRIQQYINLCTELPPEVVKKHLIESKHGQLQQMRENQAKREAEKELEKMWFELNEKENKIRMEREEREEMARKALELTVHETWFNQIRGKELLKAEEKKMLLEDKLEIERLIEKGRMEELERQKQKRRDQQTLLNDLKEQIQIHEGYMQRRKEEDERVTKACQDYNLRELEKEQAGHLGKKETIKKENALYMAFLKELEAERKEEENKLDNLMEMYRKEIQKKQDEAQCKILAAKEELRRSCHKGLGQQIALKRQEAENQLKAKQAENELLEMYYKANTRLQYESDRLAIAAAKEYREDLKQQIEYRNMMREREKEELERQLKKGREEEEKYQRCVMEIIRSDTETPENKHPFRRVLDRYHCKCSKPPST